jgi:hypothetical protein
MKKYLLQIITSYQIANHKTNKDETSITYSYCYIDYVNYIL